jgi:peroxiredoxin
MGGLAFVRVALAVVGLVAFTLWITWQAKRLEIDQARHRGQIERLRGQPAPSFHLPSLNGHAFAAEESFGKKPLVVSFWASWCGPCRAELTALTRLYERNPPSDPNYEIVAISIDGERADAQALVDLLKLPFPVLSDPTRSAAQAYAVEAIPALFVIAKDGRVSSAHIGFEANLDLALARELKLGTTPQHGGSAQ